MIEVLNALEDLDDVQNIFTNASLKIKQWKLLVLTQA